MAQLVPTTTKRWRKRMFFSCLVPLRFWCLVHFQYFFIQRYWMWQTWSSVRSWLHVFILSRVSALPSLKLRLDGTALLIVRSGFLLDGCLREVRFLFLFFFVVSFILCCKTLCLLYQHGSPTTFCSFSSFFFLHVSYLSYLFYLSLAGPFGFRASFSVSIAIALLYTISLIIGLDTFTFAVLSTSTLTKLLQLYMLLFLPNALIALWIEAQIEQAAQLTRVEEEGIEDLQDTLE